MEQNLELTINKKYETSWSGVTIMLIIGLFIGFAIFLSPSTFSGTDSWVPWVYLILLLVIIADMKFGIYATVDDGVFYEVKHFIFQRSIKITDIGKVIYQPTWVVGQKMRSLYIVDKVNNRIRIKMTNGAYPLSTLAEVIKYLKKENPAIELDESARQLIDSNQISK